MARQKGKVSVKKEWCKGCNICVTFCPKGVLALDKNVCVALNPEKCIGCKMCELRCPDFAITVEVVKEND
ncbi:MAG: 4Fe-4S binding protein [Desulfobacterales bacterium]|nr:4Fe-4S binding protein [Desulfobacterales bacterium]